MTKMKKILSIAIVLVLTVSLGAYSYNNSSYASKPAKKSTKSTKSSESKSTSYDSTGKVETVYVISDENGKTKELISSVWLKNGGSNKKVDDVSKLDDISVTKGDSSIDTKKGNDIKWNAKGYDVYYRGTPKGEAPVKISTSYTLDDKSYSLEELKGKSGHVKIEYTYKNNLASKKIPFAVVTGLTLNNEHFNNVTVSNGKIINDGKRTIACGFALPGLDNILGLSEIEDLDVVFPNSVTIEADVTDFTVGTTMSLVTNELFNSLDSDKISSLSSIGDDLGKLSDASNKLVDGSEQLKNGLGAVNTNMPRLLQGMQTLGSAIVTLNFGAMSLQQGANQLNEGAFAALQGASNLNAGLTQLSANSSTLNQSSLAVFNQLLGDARTKLNATFTEHSVPITVPELTVENYAATLTTIASQVEPSSTELAAGVRAAKTSLDNYNAYYQGLLGYTKGVDSAAEGSTTLYGGIQSISDGTVNLAAGLNTFASGTGELANGAQEIYIGLETLSAGITKLSEGSITLSDGMKQFNDEGIGKIVGLLGKDFKTVADNYKAMISASKSYQTFSGKSDKVSGEVKFIYKTDGLE